VSFRVVYITHVYSHLHGIDAGDKLVGLAKQATGPVPIQPREADVAERRDHGREARGGGGRVRLRPVGHDLDDELSCRGRCARAYGIRVPESEAEAAARFVDPAGPAPLREVSMTAWVPPSRSDSRWA
jgi:hypothetical protein